MKKYFLFLLSALVAFTASGQWLPSPYTSGNISFSSGYVGLGTSTPASKLHISTSNARETFRVYLDGNTSNYLSIFQGSGAAAIDPIGTGKLYLGYDQATDVYMGLSTGKIGIGTSFPSYKLDVEGGTRIKNSAVSSGSYTTFRLQGPDYTHGLEIDFFGNNNISSDLSFSYQGGPGSASIINVNPKPLVFGTNNQFRMLIDGAGNMGIGTSTPYAHSRIHAKAPTSSPWAIMAEANANDKVIGLSHDGTNGIVAVSSFGSGFTPLQLWTSNSPRMTVTVDGNVGIGTTNPTKKLTVNGTIYGKEVQVDLNVPGPDYVFEKDYSLPSLEEVKTYIEENKHLPEVPSAKEMEANGINVGEMNMILLKKVEELTLYLIEANKEIKKLNEKVDVLSAGTSKKNKLKN